ncbi:hypothetical protein HK097_007585 [Rhizophlyctis rosea]|uniref:BTB domain-containing protein n=1 Tax=Rhizophlyctis rosea TaxID=64517 RepID=A0AAD5SKY4_9FUNG|nr:hypothetical protein HK097_007585 [Rhizophlyctis rosea]
MTTAGGFTFGAAPAAFDFVAPKTTTPAISMFGSGSSTIRRPPHLQDSSWLRPPGPTPLTQHISKLLFSEDYSDVTVRVKQSPHVLIPAHQSVLSRCDFFKAAIDFKKQHQTHHRAIPAPIEVRIDDFGEQSVRAMLEYLYLGSFDKYFPPDLQTQFEILCLFHYGCLDKEAERYITALIWQRLTPATAFEALQWARSNAHASGVLLGWIKEWLQGDWAEVVKDGQFLDGMGKADGAAISSIWR